MSTRSEDLCALARGAISDPCVRVHVIDEGDGAFSVELRTISVARVNLPEGMPDDICSTYVREAYVALASRVRERFKVQLNALGAVSAQTCECVYPEWCALCADPRSFVS